MESSRSLPQKEQSLFKSLVRLYETKQLKKAVKTADQILKKFPEHGETLAMKGLTISQLDRKVEAYELVRKGLKKDFGSHICWHVYGLLYRSDHDYYEAAKAYLQALRRDPNNQQIIRDLALLQIQIRDYEGFEESRRKLLLVRPNQRNNWLGVALSFHLQGNFDQALQVLKTYQDTLDNVEDDQDPYEQSELLLYKISILEEAADFAGALEHLDRNSKRIVDRLAIRETRARLLAALLRHDEAAEDLRALIAINPDNHAYFRDLRIAITHALSDPDEIFRISLALCDEMSGLYPYACAPSRIALDLIPSGDHPQFLPRLDRYMRPALRRGVPSLFSDLKPLYAIPSKANAIFTLFSSYALGLKSGHSRLPPCMCNPDDPADARTPTTNSDASAEASVEVSGQDSPTTLLWIHHFLAQHWDRVGDPERALVEIEKAIAHTPTCIESILVKARILKHCGDISSAVEIADAARKMDLADRFVNTKCAKYALRANLVSKAEAWISLFTRDGDSGGVQALYDMQCMWFELEAAESHIRCKQLAPALKKLIAVERHFDDMIEDQFDFHTYCLRKVTLRSYVKMLRMEDNIKSHPYFERATIGVVNCLLQLEDMPVAERQATTGGMNDVKGFADLSDSDRKKALNKMKKREAKKRNKHQNIVQNAHHSSTRSGKAVVGIKPHGNSDDAAANGCSKHEETPESTVPSNADSSSPPHKNTAEKAKPNPGWMEIDPDGLEHVKKILESQHQELTPLVEATKRIRLLEKFSPQNVMTYVLGFEVAMRKRKVLQALRSVRRALAVDPQHPSSVSIAVRLRYAIEFDGLDRSKLSAISSVLDQKGDILEGKSIVQFVDDYAYANSKHSVRRIGAGEIMLWLAQADCPEARSSVDAVEYIVSALKDASPNGRGDMSLSVEYCVQLLQRLSSGTSGATPLSIEAVASQLRQKFPRCTRFHEDGYGCTRIT
jgi:N-alpha-acetyltransferase 15/16, NatA auxiliary subunit